ncbi:MAG: four helix bundle protein [Planctomycetota bacterium]|nr:four helix bundle protein [Planctomycetota bacterium]
MEKAPGKSIRTFRDLVAWQKGIALTRLVYRLTATFPSDERFGLVMQMRRAAVSLPANIAEGYGRGSRQEYIRYIQIARGSLFELQTHVEIARSQGWMADSTSREFNQSAEEVDRIVSGLLRSLKRPAASEDQ